MRYFGFDLGDGESCVALYSDQHIAPVILPVHGRNSFITALARYDGHPRRWHTCQRQPPS